MTSKEAFLKIESFCAYEDFQEELKAIAKDLEVLELLKESITYQEEHKYTMKEDMKGEKFMIFQHSVKGTEKVEKIKEWLKEEEWGQYE